MSQPPPPNPGVALAALAGLAGELEQHRRRLDDLADLPDQLSDLATRVERVAERLGAGHAGKSPVPITWLGFPAASADPGAGAAASKLLADLIAWMEAVYLRYPDAAQSLPGCWLWHPDVVEELLWLRQAWAAAYAGSATSPSPAGDWHDRQRPGVVRRVKSSAGTCSLESHHPGGDQHRGARRAPLAGAVGRIAEWWTQGRAEPAPIPAVELASDRQVSRRLA